ncbi:hypothetical protein QQ020_22965 [Fulvivirgaceae bacterium BMA12]|uniref:Trypsin-like peptidase domain-containing protein n=1 Tax=Agaribacillus aureus TaxID=3051825 RepID=A0ABT8LB14_9BACT|nr:hypothetical protein [Fulvivirgaceae bacterium BMA12]
MITSYQHYEEMCKIAVEQIISKATIQFFRRKGLKVSAEGSGALFSFKDNYFIVSAAHLLNFESISKLEFIIGGNFGLVSQLKTKLVVCNSGGKDVQNTDISILQINNNLISEFEKYYSFISIEHVVPNHNFTSKYFYFLYGYPASKTKIIPHQKKGYIKACGYWTYPYSSEKYREIKSIEDFKVLFWYDKKRFSNFYSVNKMHGPDAPGFSGSVMWHIVGNVIRKKEIEKVNVNPVAIMTAFDYPNKMIIGTEFYVVYGLLREAFDLRGLNIKLKKSVSFKYIDS